MRGHSTLFVGLGSGGFVTMRVLTVVVKAVANFHAQRTLSERGRVGAADCARPLGVGVDVFGEREFFVGEAIIQHEIHPHAVTRGVVRHGGAELPELLIAWLQLGF